MHPYEFCFIYLYCIIICKSDKVTIFTERRNYNVQWMLKLQCSLNVEITMQWLMKLQCSLSNEVNLFNEWWIKLQYSFPWVKKSQCSLSDGVIFLLSDSVTVFTELWSYIVHYLWNFNVH